MSDSNDSAEYDADYLPFDYFKECVGTGCDFDIGDRNNLVLGVPTWHPADTGFSLQGAEVSIFVEDAYAGHPDVPVSCYVIEALGRWSDSVQMSVVASADYGIYGVSPNEDTEVLAANPGPTGHFEKRWVMPQAPWESFSMEVKTLASRGRIEFALEKNGAGDATFYYLEISGERFCTAAAERLDVPNE